MPVDFIRFLKPKILKSIFLDFLISLIHQFIPWITSRVYTLSPLAHCCMAQTNVITHLVYRSLPATSGLLFISPRSVCHTEARMILSKVHFVHVTLLLKGCQWYLLRLWVELECFIMFYKAAIIRCSESWSFVPYSTKFCHAIMLTVPPTN